MADPEEEVSIEAEAVNLSAKPFVSGKVNVEKKGIRIHYKRGKTWHVFEHPSKVKGNVSNLHDVRRKDGTIDGQKVTCNFDLMNLGILDGVRKFLVPADRSNLRYDLANVLIYSPNDDSPTFKSKGDHFATVLAMVMPPFKGGSLTVETGDREYEHHWAANSDLQWVAFRKNCDCSMNTVTKGTSVMLMYHIFADKTPDIAGARVPILTQFLADIAKEGAEGAYTMGFPCQNLYHKALVEPCSSECMSKMLQGEDAALYQAAKASKQLKVEVVRIWEGDDDGVYVDRAFKGFETWSGNHRINKMINDRDVEYDDNVISWASDKHQWLIGGAHPREEEDDGKTTVKVNDVRCAAAILVKLPVKKNLKRKQRPVTDEEEEEETVADKKQKTDDADSD